METQTFISAAKKYSSAGISTIPVGKTKRPLFAWKLLQNRLPTAQEINNWSRQQGLFGIAAVAGTVSDNIEIIDVDCKYDLTGTLWNGFSGLIKEHSPDLFNKLVIAVTVNSGYHLLFRSPAGLVEGNKKIAGRIATDEEKAAGDKVKVLIETRGEGGYFVLEPTPGYQFIQGDISTVPTITKEERNLLFTIARSFDEMPIQNEPQQARPATKSPTSELSPFDEYNERADIPALLEQHDWEFIYQQGVRLYYLRPGQTDSQTSANFHARLRTFYVFSTSTEFESGRAYNPTQVYTTLVHNGDYSAASKALYEAGYGERHTQKQTVHSDSKQILTVEQKTVEVTKLPELSKRALYGLAGDIVRTIEPHTEADNAALLVQLLAAFGNVINKTAYFRAEADNHYTKINAVLIGMSSKGRKGSSWGQIKRLLLRVDETFENCIQDGLSSGEGLIYHVRDAQEKETSIKQKGKITGYQTEVVDSGAAEKRAFVLEPEFARVLRAMQREGNTLSSIIRQAWDSDRLKVMTKTSIKASEAHISVIGHITQEELRRNLEETETANGFANRFLWTFTRRSNFLPECGNLQESSLNEAVSRLKNAITFAKSVGELRRDDEARQLWLEIYQKLSTGTGGLLGAVTSRAESQVMRLATLYAVLDLSNAIRRAHLEAALALWQYCEDSARYVFGERVGDKSADEILNALEANAGGLDRTQISKLFSGNRSASQIKTALQSLLESGRIEQIEEKTAGRPREVFRTLRYEINEINELSRDKCDAPNTNPFFEAGNNSDEREVFEF